MLTDFLWADEQAKVTNLLRELLTLPPVSHIHFFDLILSLHEMLYVAVSLSLVQYPEDGRQVGEHAFCHVCDVLQKMEQDWHEVLLGQVRAQNISALVKTIRKASAHLPAHISDENRVQGLQPARPCFLTHCKKHRREVVRAVVSCVVVNLSE